VRIINYVELVILRYVIYVDTESTHVLGLCNGIVSGVTSMWNELFVSFRQQGRILVFSTETFELRRTLDVEYLRNDNG